MGRKLRMIEPPPPPRARLLMVDDYEDAREMYAEMLSFEGYDVATAAKRPA